MSEIAIIVTPPGGSPQDVTDDCVFARTTFESLFNAVPGSFTATIRDPQMTHSFATGWEIAAEIDGIRMFGGYVTQVSMEHFAPAADTSDLEDYDLRIWVLRGTDYNIIFDRRVWRSTSDYLSAIDLTGAAIDTDGPALIELIENYSDCDDFSTSGINSDADLGTFPVVQQGDKLRKDFTIFSFFGATVWYINGDKVFVYVPFEDVTKDWGFSDQPNGVTSIGFREVEAVEDGSFIENDVFIWGGSEFAGSGGGTVVARVQDTDSQDTYGRWQYAETHFGQTYYKTQAGVDAAADVIVNGPPGADVYGQQKGLRYSQWQFTFTWFSSDVPGADHVLAGDIMQIDMTTFGVEKLLPLRSLRISFPDAFEDDGSHLVQFTGTFGLQLSDPFTLWAYLLHAQGSTPLLSPAAVTNDNTQTVYGATYQGVPSPATDDTTTTFTIPFGYVAGSLQVFLTGAILINGVDFIESDPATGEFEMAIPPPAAAWLYCLAVTLAS
jgi:hypothetical protein